jgi:hypothetical protein
VLEARHVGGERRMRERVHAREHRARLRLKTAAPEVSIIGNRRRRRLRRTASTPRSIRLRHKCVKNSLRSDAGLLVRHHVYSPRASEVRRDAGGRVVLRAAGASPCRRELRDTVAGVPAMASQDWLGAPPSSMQTDICRSRCVDLHRVHRHRCLESRAAMSCLRPNRSVSTNPGVVGATARSGMRRLVALLLAAVLPSGAALAQSSANYAYTTATNGALVDMSSGTTLLIAADQDDVASAVTPIGFDLVFQGVAYSQFSANSNGLIRLGPTAAQTASPYKPLGQAGLALIAPYGADQRTHTTGRVHFRVDGTAPNRVLVVEFLNMQANFNAAGAANLTYQVLLSETSGAIEFRYGSMAMSTLGAADANSRDPHIGFSSGNVAGTIGTVTAPQSGTPTPSFAGNVASAVANLYIAGPIDVLTSAANGSRRTFSFTPPVPTAPTSLSFSAVTATSMNLAWVDSPDEVAYLIYRSTDGVNFARVGSVAANTTSFAATGLQPSTSYSWRVFSASEGALSAPAAAPQGTPAPGNDTCAAAGGNWDDTATWADGSVPTTADNVTIGNGCTVTVNVTNAAAFDVTVLAGGVLQSPTTGTVTNNNLTVAGSVVNQGSIDFSTNGDTSGARLTFGAGGVDVSLTGGGLLTDLRELAIDKGDRATVVTIAPDNLTVRGAASGAPGVLVLTSGTVRFAGSYTLSNALFSTAAYTIPAAAGLWIDNPNFTIAGQNGSPTNNGLLRLTQGTFNVGTSAGNSMGGGTGAVFRIEGGAMNIAGRLQTTSVVQYLQTGGTLNLSTVGNAAATASFGLTATGNSFDFAGGTIVLVQPSTNTTPLDYSVSTAATFVTNPAQTILQLGNAAAPAAAVYRVAGATPNVIVTAGRTMNVGSGTAGGAIFLRGASLVNNGAIATQGTSSRLDFAASGPMSYSGTGTLGTATTPFAGVGISSNSVFPITLLSPIFVNRVNLFSGGFINSNQITLGSGGTSTTVVQVGSAGLTVPGGSFDVSPVHNQGSGGQILIYAQESVPRTTGFEINPTRVINRVTLDNTNGLVLAGGDLEANSTTGATTNALTLTNGTLRTGSNTLFVSAATGVVVRTNGYVVGNLRKTFDAVGSKTFEVGTANGYSPVSFNVTAGTFPATITASAVQGTAPGFTPASLAIARHWNLTASGITADVTFTYLDPLDLGTVTESNLRAFRQDGPTYVDVGGTVTAATNTLTVSGVSTFSTWTLAEPVVRTLTITPTSLDFGSVNVGTTSPEQTVTLANTGNASLDVTALSAAAAPFARTATGTCAGTLPITLAAGASCTLTYTYTPAATGAANQTLTVTSSGTGSGTIALAGNGVQGSLAITPTSVNFGSVNVGTPSAEETVTLANTGNASLDVTALSAAAAPFARTATGSCPATLPITIAAGASCTLTYTYTPTAAGAASQNLTVTANAPGSGTIALSGNGIAGEFSVTPNPVAFGNQLVGTTSMALTATLSNSGAGSLTVSALPDPSAPFARSGGTCGATPFAIAGGSSCTVQYTFAPTASGAANGSVAIVTSVASVNLSLTGSGIQGALAIAPTTVAFGNVLVGGTSNAQTVTLSNNGTASLDVTALTAASAPFARSGGTCAATPPITIAAGGSCTLIYTFAPTTAGAANQTLTVTANAPGSGTIALTGTGTPSADLSIVKSSATNLLPSGLIQYTLVVSNAGPSAVTGAIVADTLPAVVTSAVWSCSGIAGGVCGTANGTGNINRLVDLPVGATVVYSISGNVALPLPASITNTATVTAPTGVTDPVTGNNSSTVVDVILIFADGFETAGTGPSAGMDGTTRLPATAVGAWAARPIAATDLARATSVTATDIASFDIEGNLVVVQARRIGGVLEVRLLQADAGRAWQVGNWFAVDAARDLRFEWSTGLADARGVPVQVRLSGG